MDNIYFQNYDSANILKFSEYSPQQIIGVRTFSQKYFFIKNNVYLNANREIFFLKIDGETRATKLKGLNGWTTPIVIDRNGHLYFGADNGIFILKTGETAATKINGINDPAKLINIDNGNNVWIITDNSLYKVNIENKINLNFIIKSNNFGEINNNDDETILNNLNYLNRENNYFLNLNKMKVINKTPTSATIVATKGKYRGEVTVNYKIKNKDEISAIDFNDLVKKQFTLILLIKIITHLQNLKK